MTKPPHPTHTHTHTHTNSSDRLVNDEIMITLSYLEQSVSTYTQQCPERLGSWGSAKELRLWTHPLAICIVTYGNSTYPTSLQNRKLPASGKVSSKLEAKKS